MTADHSYWDGKILPVTIEPTNPEAFICPFCRIYQSISGDISKHQCANSAEQVFFLNGHVYSGVFQWFQDEIKNKEKGNS